MGKIFSDLYDAVLTFFLSGSWTRIVVVLKALSLLVSAALLAAIIILLFKIRKEVQKALAMIAESTAAEGAGPKVVDVQWQAVLDKVEGDNPDAYKTAVLEADKIFDDLLKRMGYAGADMGGRLKQVTRERVPNLDDIWQAHKIRNRIAHEPDFQVTRAQAKMAVEAYRQAITALGALNSQA